LLRLLGGKVFGPLAPFLDFPPGLNKHMVPASDPVSICVTPHNTGSFGEPGPESSVITIAVEIFVMVKHSAQRLPTVSGCSVKGLDAVAAIVILDTSWCW